MFRILLVLFFCILLKDISAQKVLLTADDTISKAEYLSLKEITPAGQYFLIDSFSNLGDSVNASEWLLKIHPYVLLYEYEHVDLLQAFLSKNIFTKEAKELCRKNYLDAYNAPKPESYTTFRQMANEDQEIRRKAEKVEDSGSVEYFYRKMRKSDSIHAAFIYTYVQKNEWPSLESGSMYATLLAIHDHTHHKFYLPYLKKAILQGQSEISGLKLMLFWLKQPQYSFATDYKKYKSYSFDVSSLLNDEMPNNFERIYRTISKARGKKNYHTCFVYRNQSINDFHDWLDRKSLLAKNNMLWKLTSDLGIVDKKKGLEHNWYLDFEQSNIESLRFYIFY